ncbi:MAG: class I SAM-dependent methyltransferase [Candidatus Hydrogenedentes bacterium]|nr:class I SAM-dependent methyltransferase [Candidatus Hydrogenedentota bacterium]
MPDASGLYEKPGYYALAFSYRDFAREVDVFEECIQRFSRITVEAVLEICCGHAPHLEELHRRGYRYAGIDRSEEMLTSARSRAKACGAPAQFTNADIAHFSLPEPVDFAYVALASLYVTSTAELRAHFRAMGDALRSGGLYFMEWCVDFDPMVDIVDSWEVERDGVHIRASYWTCSVNRIEQTYEDTLHLEINDHGTEFVLEDKAIRRRIFPQEFLAFIRDHTQFEFVGWWNDWNLDQPVTGEHGVDRPIIVVRRR